MSIVNSTCEWSGLLSGTKYVTEWHTDHTGKRWPRSVVVGPGIDPETLLTAHAAEVEQELAELEARSIVDG